MVFDIATAKYVMILCEERNTIYDIFDRGNNSTYYISKFIDNRDLDMLKLRARYNPDLKYYIVHCDNYVELGFSYDYVLNMIKDSFLQNNCQKSLDELFQNIKKL